MWNPARKQADIGRGVYADIGLCIITMLQIITPDRWSLPPSIIYLKTISYTLSVTLFYTLVHENKKWRQQSLTTSSPQSPS